jgi:hypothetical protein
LLWQEQLSFQAVENRLILHKFLVGVASLCHKEIGVQIGSSDYMLSHSFPVPCISRFRSLFYLILLGVFLAFSSLGAGSSKRTQTPLGAHQ